MSAKENKHNLDTSDCQTAIELNDLVHVYGNPTNKGAQLRFDNWKVQSGQQVFLYGDSGSGKSTLLNLLSGILAPQQGSIKLFGNELSDLSNSQRDRFRAENIGVVFQQFNLIPYLSVAKNIELAVYLAKSSKQDLQASIKQFVSALNLPSNILNKPVSSLSIGQQQRVAIMRAFINSPKLLLIDESTSALDNTAKQAFMSVLMEICQANKTTMIFVSHDLELKRYFSLHTPLSSFCQLSHQSENYLDKEEAN
ncbi:ATP-binding cassette domain-containing protein [Paraglaciecola aquimarina]|uniref:ATP-binding cassette domain-containing protein n=1 Tax=Paraglaciecola algarum TaxID=3050085 RepID=A0ABS9D3J7_9ALTE|nr:ATP-binding cassette domain-containing protein [Paraglaciecola sp. G1-23]MCF2947506.1 ATP-binding cassette domain-containing protein [Paraglaciecola sp. G1-23]